MNIKEAYAKATSGPMMAVQDIEHIYNLETRTHPRRKDKRQIVASCLVLEDAALLAHAYNHMRDVLKVATGEIRHDGGDVNTGIGTMFEQCSDICPACAIIAKASEVKVL